jgi:hypothetical protein
MGPAPMFSSDRNDRLNRLEIENRDLKLRVTALERKLDAVAAITDAHTKRQWFGAKAPVETKEPA